ncbi:MAG: ArnT family glycosyltransferase [Rhodospirillaceae bacterium]
MPEGGAGSQVRRRAPAALLSLLAVATYGAIGVFTLFNAQTFTEEVAALVRSWWYATGAVVPYSPADVPPEMPLYYFELGFWQRLLGPGHLSGRLLSIGLGAASGLLLFAICRRLSANTLVAAAAAFIFLATPSTSFFFGTATSAAAVSLLHLVAIWLIVVSMGRPRPMVSALMGIVCALLYFTRQEMFLAVIVLIPLYAAALGRDRALQSLIVVGAFAVTSAVGVVLLPERFAAFALDLPVFGPFLGDAGLLGPDYTLVARGTHAMGSLGAAFEAANLKGLLESFMLPNLGTLILAIALFGAASGPLKILWAAPLYFLWLALAHYLAASSEGACETCMHAATPAFAAVGALAAALTLAMSGRWARRHNVGAGTAIVLGAFIAVALNTFAPALASHPAAKSFPRPMLDGVTAAPELSEIPVLTRWVASHLKTRQPVLVIQGFGRTDLAALPYAVAAAGHAMPAESLDLKGTRRTINQSLVGDMRESVRAAVEADGLWNEEIMRRWIERDYNVILLQDDASTAALKKDIEGRFDAAGTTRYRGRNVVLFTRKPAP